MREAALEKQILRVWKDSGERYGAWKVWDQLNREGIAAARCTVERLMRKLGLRGSAAAVEKPRTTVADPSQDRPADLVNSDFAPAAPDRLWVVDFTFVPTRAGTAYTALVIDAFSRLIAGWRTAASHGTDLVLDALVMAVTYRARQGVKVAGLIHRSDAGQRGRIQSVVATPSGGGGRMGRPQGWAAARAGRPRRCVRRGGLRWPGEKTGSGSGWRSPGECPVRTGIEAGVSPAVGTRWFRDSGGIRPVSLAPLSGRYLSFAEREEIAILRVRGCGVREIARRTGRSPSTISRELAGTLRPGAVGWSTGPWPLSGTRICGHAVRRSRNWLRIRRCGSMCKTGSAARSPGLVAWLCRARMCAGSDARHGRRADRRWARSWSPEQIANRLRIDFPDDESMRVSHETIYQALYVQGRGALRRELTAYLRTGRALRVPRARTRGRGRKFVTSEIMISQRPAEAADRAVPGHWEGDLIVGLNSSAIGTLVERSTRFTMLLHLPPMEGHGTGPRAKNGPALAGHGAEAVRDAIASGIVSPCPLSCAGR